ncbi:MAG TPA: very short patch repair endonuclease [Afipia sp.]
MKTPDEVRSRTMRAVKGKNTQPEWTVRRLLHAAGYRYRLHVADLPGKPDLVFPAKRKVIFVHGCWWHGHSCARGARPAKTNASYWSEKIARNRDRDVRNLATLRASGWKVHVVWECQIKKPGLLARLKRFLSPVQPWAKLVP